MKKIKKIFVVLMSLAFVSSIVSSFIIVSAEEVEKVQENSHTIVEEYNTNKIESRIAGLIGWIHGQNNKVEINITPVRNPNNNRIQMAFKNVGNLTGEINGSVLLYHMSGIGTLPIPIGSGRVKNQIIGPGGSFTIVVTPNVPGSKPNFIQGFFNVKIPGVTVGQDYTVAFFPNDIKDKVF